MYSDAPVSPRLIHQLPMHPARRAARFQIHRIFALSARAGRFAAAVPAPAVRPTASFRPHSAPPAGSVPVPPARVRSATAFRRRPFLPRRGRGRSRSLSMLCFFFFIALPFCPPLPPPSVMFSMPRLALRLAPGLVSVVTIHRKQAGFRRCRGASPRRPFRCSIKRRHAPA